MNKTDYSIECPNCNTVFEVDKSRYNEIIKQIKDKEFETALEQRSQHIAIIKEKEIVELKAEKEKEIVELKAEKEKEISDINSRLQNSETNKKLAVSEAVREVEKERDGFRNQIQNKEIEINQLQQQHNKDLIRKDEIINEKDEQILYHKDMKLKQSTKMVGESLEQHCQNEFNKLRTMSFPNAYFEKDNDVSAGSKGDYIFRECDEFGNEIVSIMFEMKNESDETKTKKKNEDFFKRLDKNRNDKKCEYAVLVSLLEKDNDYYNVGIQDISYKYDKMFVVRPQFFIQIISLLRISGMKSLKFKAEVELMKKQNTDITNFEERIEKFKNGFFKNADLSSRQFQKAIEEIDKSIKSLNNVKMQLTKSEKNLQLAGNKLENLTIKKLTHGNKTMKKAFESLEGNGK